jgi:hypothetical protein
MTEPWFAEIPRSLGALRRGYPKPIAKDDRGWEVVGGKLGKRISGPELVAASATRT